MIHPFENVRSSFLIVVAVGALIAVACLTSPEPHPETATSTVRLAPGEAPPASASATSAGLPVTSPSPTLPIANAPVLTRSTEVLHALMTCWTQQNCEKNFGATESIDLDLRARQALETYTAEFQSQPKRVEEATAFATYFIAQPAPEVKLAALRLFTRLPRHTENLNTILTATHQVDSAILLEQTLEEISHYTETANREKIENYLKANLLNGSFVSSPAVARKMTLFLNRSNLRDYERVLRSLPLQSRTRKNLEMAVQAYRTTYGL